MDPFSTFQLRLIRLTIGYSASNSEPVESNLKPSNGYSPFSHDARSGSASMIIRRCPSLLPAAFRRDMSWGLSYSCLLKNNLSDLLEGEIRLFAVDVKIIFHRFRSGHTMQSLHANLDGSVKWELPVNPKKCSRQTLLLILSLTDRQSRWWSQRRTMALSSTQVLSHHCISSCSVEDS